MFVYSVRATTIKFFALMFAGIAALVAIILFIPTYGSNVVNDAAVSGTAIKYDNADTNEGRIEFLKGFGYEVSDEAIEQRQVTIPESFDTVFDGYNEMQKEQGLDLSKYKRKTVTRYTYTVTNYEGYDGTVLANLLVFDSCIIGGDICSEAQNGFVHGFEKK